MFKDKRSRETKRTATVTTASLCVRCDPRVLPDPGVLRPVAAVDGAKLLAAFRSSA